MTEEQRILKLNHLRAAREALLEAANELHAVAEERVLCGAFLNVSAAQDKIHDLLVAWRGDE
jgi:hypothetical protein